MATRVEALAAAAVAAAKESRKYSCSLEYHHQLLADAYHREYAKLRDQWVKITSPS